MSRNGSGVYSLPAGNPVVTGTTISSSWANTTLSDIATALTGSVASDGQTAMTGNLQMGSNKITGLAVATSSGDALSYGQAANVTDLTVTGNATVGGTLTLTGGLTLNGNVTVGDSSADTLTVNATSTFAAGATFSSTFAANGGVTLGDASGDALTINSSAVSIPNGLNFDSNTLVIDATNNAVNIGTTTSGGKLTIKNPSSASEQDIFVIQGATNTTSIAKLTFDQSVDQFKMSANTSAGFLVFGTGTGGTERMRITSTGNVGIGTSSPSTQLQVSSSTGSTLRIENTNTGLTTGSLVGGLEFYSNDTSSGGTGVAGYLKTVSTNSFGNIFNTVLGVSSGNANNYLSFETNATERMRLDSSGNLGLGVTPSAWTSGKALEVNAVGNGVWSGFGNTYLTGNYYFGTTNKFADTGYALQYLLVPSNGSHQWVTSTASGTAGNTATLSTKMTLDASGNLGLGVTPSSWSTSYKALEINGISLMGSTATNDFMSLGVNFYFNGTNWIYKSSEYSTRYYQVDGTHQWYTAPSGTAGNAITFTQAMTLDASGRLLVGTTSSQTIAGDTGLIQVETANAAANISIVRNTNNNASSLLTFGKSRGATLGGRTIVSSGDTLGGIIFNGADGTNMVYSSAIYGQVDGTPGTNDMPGRLVFSTTADGASSPTERMRIDSSGNLLVGTTAVQDFTSTTSAGINLVPSGVLSASRSAGASFVLQRTTSDGSIAAFYRTNTLVGTISVTTTATAYNTSSDYRLKNNPAPLTGSGAFIDALQPKTWTWTADGSTGVGFIAHEVQAISPNSVTGEKDAVDENGNPVMQSMEYGSAEFIANIIAELQDLRKRVATLESK